MSNNPSRASVSNNSSARHPLERNALPNLTPNLTPNSPGPMILHVNDSSLPPPPYTSSSLSPLLNSVPVINRLPSIDATSITGVSTTGSIRSNSSSLRLTNTIYNTKSSGMSSNSGTRITNNIVNAGVSPTLNHRIHGSRNRRTNLQQQIQLQLQQQQQLHMHFTAANPNDVDVQVHQQQRTTPTLQLPASQAGRSRHRHHSNDSSVTSSSDHSDISCVTDDETADSCCNFDCFNCKRASKSRLQSCNHHHSHRCENTRSGHASDALNDLAHRGDPNHQRMPRANSTHGDNAQGNHVAPDDHIIHFTSTEDDESGPCHSANVSRPERDYKSLGGCICCVPIFCCPTSCITNCNGQIITSYVLALVATAFVVSGVYCSLLFWNRLWLILSIIGIVFIILGTIIHYTGSKSLNRKLRSSVNGGLFKSLPRTRHRLRPVTPTDDQMPMQLHSDRAGDRQRCSDNVDPIRHQPKNKSKINTSNVHAHGPHATRINNNINHSSQRASSTSAPSPSEACASTSHIIYEELIDSQNRKSSNCDDTNGQYQKIQRIKRSLRSDKLTQDSCNSLEPLSLVSKCSDDHQVDESKRAVSTAAPRSNSTSLSSPQIVDLDGHKFLILPIDNSAQPSVSRVTSLADQSIALPAIASSSKVNHKSPGKVGDSTDGEEDDLMDDDGPNGEDESVISADNDDEDTGNDDKSNNYLLSPDIKDLSNATGLQLIPLDLLCPSDASTITRKQSVTDFICKLDPSRLLPSQNCLTNDSRLSKAQALLAQQIDLMKQQQDNRQDMLCMLSHESKNVSSLDLSNHENECLMHTNAESGCDDVSLLHALNVTCSEKGKKKFLKKNNQRSTRPSHGVHAIEASSNLRKKRSSKVKKLSKQVKSIGQLDCPASPDECLQTDQEDLSLISLPSTSTQSTDCNSIEPSLSKARSSASGDISIITSKLTNVIASTDSSAVSTPIAPSSMSSSYQESLTSSHSANSGSLGDSCNIIISPSTSSVTSPSRIEIYNGKSARVIGGDNRIDNTCSTLVNIAHVSSLTSLNAQSPSQLSSHTLPSPSNITVPPPHEQSDLQVDFNHSSQLNKLNSGQGSSKCQSNRHTVTLPLIYNECDRQSNVTVTHAGAAVSQSVSQPSTGSMSASGPSRGATAFAITIDGAASICNIVDSTPHEASATALHDADDNVDHDDDESCSDDSTASSSSFLFFRPPQNGRSPRFTRKKSSRNRTVTLGKVDTIVEASAPPLCGTLEISPAVDSHCAGSDLSNELKMRSSRPASSPPSSFTPCHLASNCTDATSSSSTRDEIVFSINQSEFEIQVQDKLNHLTKSLAPTCASQPFVVSSTSNDRASTFSFLVGEPTHSNSSCADFNESAYSSSLHSASDQQQQSSCAPPPSNTCISSLDTRNSSPRKSSRSDSLEVAAKSLDNQANHLSATCASAGKGVMTVDIISPSGDGKNAPNELTNESDRRDDETSRSLGHSRKRQSITSRPINRYATRTIDRSSEADRQSWQTVSPNVASSGAENNPRLTGAVSPSRRSLTVRDGILSDQRDTSSSGISYPPDPSSGAKFISDALVASESGKTSRTINDGSVARSALARCTDGPSVRSTFIANEASAPDPSSLTPHSSSNAPSELNSTKSIANVTTCPQVSNVTTATSKVTAPNEINSEQDARGKHTLSHQVDARDVSARRATFFLPFPSTQSTMDTAGSLATNTKNEAKITSKLTSNVSAGITLRNNDDVNSPSIASSSSTHAEHSRLVGHSQSDNPSSALDTASGTSLTRSGTFSKGSNKNRKKRQVAPQHHATDGATGGKNDSPAAQDVTRAPDRSTGAIPRLIKRQLTQTLMSDDAPPRDAQNAARDERVASSSGGRNLDKFASDANASGRGSQMHSALVTSRNNYLTSANIDNDHLACSSSDFYPHVYEELYFTDVNSCNSKSVKMSKPNENGNQCTLFPSNLNHPSYLEDGIDRGLSDGDFGRLVNCDNSTEQAINSIQSPPPSYFDVIENSSLYQTLSQSELQQHLTNSNIATPSSSSSATATDIPLNK